MTQDHDSTQDQNETAAPAEVKNIADEKIARKKDGKTLPKVKPIKLYEALFCTITNDVRRTLPRPAWRIETYEIEPGVKQPVLFDPISNDWIKINIAKVKHLLMAYTRGDLLSFKGYDHFQLTPTHGANAAEYWYCHSQPIEKPKLIGFKNTPQDCFRRIPFDLNTSSKGKVPTPLFDEMFSRVLSNKTAVKAFIWSIFEEQSYEQQYLWLFGKSNDGKGALTRVLLRALGFRGTHSVGAIQNTAPWRGNKHWAIPFLDQRLVVFPDFKDASSLDNGILKSLTGGDSVYVDPKGLPGYTAKLQCKLIYGSNDMPNIGNSEAGLRRIIFAEFKQTSAFDRQYEEKLWLEFPAFLLQCREVYETVCPHHGKIPTDEEALQSLSDDLEDKYLDMQAIFDRHFKESEESTLAPIEVTNRLIESGHRDPREQKRFKDWLNIKGFKAKRSGSSPRVIRGLKLKPFPR